MQNTCEATGGSERFSAMIVFIVPAMVFLPSSRLSRRPDFSTKKTATVNATHKKKRHRSLTTCPTTCISIYTRSRLQIISFIPLSSNSDQHQFSPKDIRSLSREMVMRINKMITKEKIP